MSGGRIQFFMRPEEFLGWLRGAIERESLSCFETQQGRFTVVDDLATLPERFYITGAAAGRSEELAALPEGADAVVVVPPREDGDRLMMGDIAPARKDSSRQLYRRLREELRSALPLWTRATNVLTGGSDVYRDVWASSGALAAKRRGCELRQVGVENVVFSPEEPSDGAR